ncbi:MAG: PspA/IM30 family protein [Pseudomonadota bacterium]
MSFFKRINATINASMDRAISKVENHDAIIDAALKDTQRAAARSRVRLERVRKDGASLKARQTSLKTAAERWAERARSIAETDEAKALECLRRRRDCLAQLDALNTSIQQHDELQTRISEQTRRIEERIGEVTHQRNMMRSRQSVADAMQTIHNVQGSAVSDIEDTFDRWEINLGETEIRLGAAATDDPLDAAFLNEETTADLRAELHELLSADGKGDAS